MNFKLRHSTILSCVKCQEIYETSLKSYTFAEIDPEIKLLGVNVHRATWLLKSRKIQCVK
jgi:hypothetical protein